MPSIKGEESDRIAEYLPEERKDSNAPHSKVTTTLDSLHVLLENFKDLFHEPNSIPLRRPLDHAIPLKPHTTLVNIRAYQYSPTQKAEI